MIPNVNMQKTDGNLGVASSTDRILAVVGPSSAGTVGVAVSVTNKADLVTAFGQGPLVEACGYMIARGLPVVAVRSTGSTVGAYGAIVATGKTGTSTITAGGSAPQGDYDPVVQILTGGTVGTAGIVFRYSLDGGVNFSQGKSQGTATTMTLENGVSFALGAGTLIANDTWSTSTTAPKSSSSDLAIALTALSDYSGEWLRVLVLADADTTILAQGASFTDPFHADGKYPEVITNVRPRGAAETRAAYQTALAAIAAAVQSAEVSCCVDQGETISEISGRRLRMPQSVPYAARTMLVDDAVDPSAKADGAVPNFFLTNAAGVSVYHDERKNPGLDVLGFTTLRSYGGRPVSPGVYVNNARVLSGAGSDYRFFQHSAIVNRVIEAAYSLLLPRLSQAVLLEAATGRIREDVAKSIEDACTTELRSRFADPGRVSGVRLVLSRTDNVLSTDTLSFSVQVQPLGYVKQFVGKVGLVRVLPTAA